MPHLRTTPCRILVDETPLIRASGLDPHQEVTLVAHMFTAKKHFIAHAHYTANQDGVFTNVDCASSGGTYTGTHATTHMGTLGCWQQQDVESTL